MYDFSQYKKVAPDGSNLGVLLEVGCGPWSQSYPMIQARNFKYDKYLLLDPGIIDYSKIRSSIVNKRIQPNPIFIKSSGEDMSFIENTIDTLVMINVLEHVENSIKILRAVYNALKPGGIIIFNDRWWDREGTPGQKRKLMDLDVLYHPIRLHKEIFDIFLNGFHEIYRIDSIQSWAFTKDNRNYDGTYFIGKKKNNQVLTKALLEAKF
jgi:SAM-dependent methyltransferase